VEGIYQGKGINPIEARAVADAVCDHARSFPNLSLGVGTFNMNQQQLIQDEIDSRRRADPSIEPFFAKTGEDRFFVKNLENIQGDDRDVIFISIGYGPDEAGKIRYNFGPVNGANGWRRLNVILTRAKIALKVFSSMRGDQIDPTRAVSDGAKYLRDFLQYAERGTLALPAYDPNAEFESPFEQSVFETLTAAGLNLVPQVGQAGYRIDFGVLDLEFPGRFLAGIECDGATYHSATTARDRDRLRQQVLENLGWRLCRIWSVDWNYNRKAQVERVRQFIEACKQRSDKAGDSQRSTRLIGSDSLDHESPTANSVSAGAEARNNVLYSSLPPAPLYRLAVMTATATSDDFNTATDQFVTELIQYTLSFESPIHIDELARRVCTYFSITRAGNKVKDRIHELTCRMSLEEELSLRTDFIWRRGQEHVTVYSRAIDYKFPPEHISPEEYAAAIISVLERRPNRMQDELVADTARYLGFARAGQKINELISDAIKRLIERDIVTAGATGLRLVNGTEVKLD
jgi:very-short-patch-repair endonuclease